MGAAIELGRGYLSLVISAKGVGAEVNRVFRGAEREADRSGKQSGKKFGGGFGAQMKNVIGIAAIYQGAKKLVDLGTEAVAEAREAQKVSAVTDRMIKATGSAAKVTAADVSKLANAISLKTGIDDEAVQASANLLLAYKGVKNEVGTGNKIFDRATASAIDLSKAGFGSAEGASKKLGKALNDPIKGLSGLTRMGVQFTDQQKDQIEKMVKSGDVLGAQKIILEAVEKRVGGVAAAQATMGEKAKVAGDNFKEQIGTIMLPLIDRFHGFMINKAYPALLKFGNFLARELPPAIAKVKAFLGPIVNTLQAFAERLRASGQQGTFLKDKVVPAAIGVRNAFMGLWKVVGPILKAVYRAIKQALIDNMPAIRSSMNSVKGIVVSVMKLVQAVIQRVTKIIKFIWDRFGDDILKIIKNTFNMVFGVVKNVLKLLHNVIKLVTNIIKGDWKGAWTNIKDIFKNLLTIIFTIGKGLFNNLRIVIDAVMTQVRAKINEKLNQVRAKFNEIRSWVVGSFKRAWSAVTAVFWAPIEAGRKKVAEILGKIKRAFDTTKANIKKSWEGVKKVINDPITWVKDKVYNGVLVPVWNKVAKLVGAGELQKLARGGVAEQNYGIRPGYTPGRDTHLIAVSGGEPVLRPEAGRVLGRKWVDGVNLAARTRGTQGVQEFLGQGGQGFASGGIVGWLKNTFGSAASAITGLAGKMKDWVLGGLTAAARAATNPLRRLINDRLKGSGVADTVGKIANKVLDLILTKIQGTDQVPGMGGGGPIGAGGFARALVWARSQAGKPYRYPMVGPGSYDCSGFISAVINAIRGRNPHSRLFSTGMFQGGPSRLIGMTRNKRSPFMIGVIPTGETSAALGHVAGTLNGVNVESSGGVGVRVGPRARGWNNSLFKYFYGMARGGIFGTGITGDLPFDTLSRRGERYDPLIAQLIAQAGIKTKKFDQGGHLEPYSATLAINSTPRREKVGFGTDQQPLVGQLTLVSNNSDVGEDLDTISYKLRVLRRGGVDHRAATS